MSGKTPPNAKEILENLLGNWPLSKQSPRVLFTKKTSIVKIHIPKKGALQSAIKIGCVSLTPHDKDYFELKFLSVSFLVSQIGDSIFIETAKFLSFSM